MTDDKTLEDLFGDASRIPAAPGVALALAKLCGEEDCSIDRLVSVLKCDPALTAKILRMANSVYFGSRREIAELSEAIVRLGLRRVQIMSLAFCIIEKTSGKAGRGKGFNYSYFWSHALVAGTYCDALATTRNLALAGEAMVAGLLQDIGVLIIQTCMPEKYRSVLAFQRKTHEALYLTEDRQLGLNHMETGELLLRRWHLPESLCQAVGNHHHPEKIEGDDGGTRDLAKACQVGAAVAKFLTRGQGRSLFLSSAMETARQGFGIDHEEFQNLLTLSRMKMEVSAEILNVDLDEIMLRRLDIAIRDKIAETVMAFPDDTADTVQ